MDRERYLRQQDVEGLGVGRLQSMHVSVVGAGAVGNEVVKNLVLMGVGAIDVHDFDRVEIHNLTRSIFLREADVGAGKAGALVARAAEIDPNVRLRAIEGDVWRTLRLADLARRDVIICAVDNLHKLKDAFQNEHGWVPVYYLFDSEGKLKSRAAGEFGVGVLTGALEKMFPSAREAGA